ncbi:exodeoxyribonuclease I [Agaribacterium haliotis]|uniref:exodeoxyribonuclease I n=1 Tax=Agaribacterium haliotis TaxID=2013869 RepID=UPI000BB567BB|nr:exodeoxyribonuclease I [Agaribacterium haliotis]
MTTLYWHDYESWGANPSVDRPAQFAGVRTDEELNIISEPLVLYCKPAEDVLPHAEACLVTGISPQLAQQKGLPEYRFMREIHRELATPGTVGVGYNSLRFDDEMTRYSLYRNFYEPYEREWRYGNGRWDIIDMMRLVYALRPEGIHWPEVDGKPSFRLELLTAANGISHGAAHDAYSDVEASIQLARKVRQLKPELYNYVYAQRTKKSAAKMIDVRSRKPLLHISSKFPASRGCAGLIVPLAAHPQNNNAVICFELSVDPAALENLNAEQIRQRVFSAQSELPEGQERLPLKLVHLNKCPILLPTRMLDEKAAARLGIDRQRCEKHWQKLLGMELEFKLREVFSEQNFAKRDDAEQQLYDGFIGDADKHTMKLLREAGADAWVEAPWHFADQRLNDILPRYKARNFPELLSEAERNLWQQFVAQRLRDGEPGIQSCAQLKQRIHALRAERELDDRAVSVLGELEAWADGLANQYLTNKR